MTDEPKEQSPSEPVTAPPPAPPTGSTKPTAGPFTALGSALTNAHLPAWAGLVLSVILAFQSCARDRTISDLSEQENAAQYQPTIRVQGRPTIDSLQLTVPSVSVTPEGGITLDGAVHFGTRLTLKNTSSIGAKMLMVASADTMSGTARLREILRDKTARENQLNPRLSQDFYGAPHLMPGDSVSRSFASDIIFAQDSVFTLHYIMLYENALGQVYDTYYWARFKSVRLQMQRAATGSDSVAVWELKHYQLGHLFEYVDSREEYFIYPQAEAKALLEWFRRKARK